MAHYHITLIGGQSYPVCLGILDQKPDGVVLVHSCQSKEEAERIKKEIKVPTQLIEFEPVNVGEIYNQLRRNFPILSADDVYTVNITGGTKLWSIAFYDYFKRYPNSKLIYIDQNNCVCNLVSFEIYQSTVALDTDLVFRLNGTRTESYLLFEEYTDEDKICLEKMKKLRKHSFKGFNTFSMPKDKGWKNDLEQKKNACWNWEENHISWDKDSKTIELSLKYRGKEKREILESPHVFELFFNTGWFEYDVACILSKWEYAKEIRMNVKFPYLAERNPKNEIDLIVNTGNRLLFVECKTQINDITDIDKFRTAVKNYGGMACKALFITDAPMKKTAEEKCRDSGIISFSIEDCKNGLLTVSKALNLKLGQELLAINKK